MTRSHALVVLAVLVFLTGCASSGTTPANRQGSALQAFSLQQEGAALFQQGKYAEALRRFEEADRVQPNNATVANMLGLCHLKLEQYDEALASFGKALAITPAFADARNNRGLTYLSMGQYRMAEIDFSAVLADQTYAHHWNVYYNLGMTYLQRGQIAAAEENLRRAATAGTPVFQAFLRLSEIALEKGATDKAIEWLEDARLAFPDQLEPSLRLGELLTQLGRGDEARRFLVEVVESEPGSESARQARELLAILE